MTEEGGRKGKVQSKEHYHVSRIIFFKILVTVALAFKHEQQQTNLCLVSPFFPSYGMGIQRNFWEQTSLHFGKQRMGR